MSIQRRCQSCDAAFSVYPYVVQNGGGKFCSRRCHFQGAKGKPSPKTLYGTRSCAICGGSYTNSHARHVCCSPQCGVELRTRRKIAAVETRFGGSLRTAIEQRLLVGMSMRAITVDLGISDTRFLGRIMDRLGIKRTDRSEAVRLQWERNPTRRAEQSKRWREYVSANPERARAQSIAANLKLQTTSPTSIEQRLMGALDEVGISYEFQYVVGGKFLCDFGFPAARLIVEADGSYWHRTERQKKRDASKDAYLRACGFTVLRFTDKHIAQQLDTCLEQIKAHLPE